MNKTINRPDIDGSDSEIIKIASNYSMTSTERLVSLIDAVKYVCENKIAGSIVECGVWRGGSMMAVALKLMSIGDVDRDLYLYDTFEGMPAPDDNVDLSFDRKLASKQLAVSKKNADSGIWCIADLDDVKKNMMTTGYPEHKIHFIKGKVEETIPGTTSSSISLLRLDTDWYSSTKHELNHLYPRLSKFGLLIVDDYGHWQGAQKACDEYFSEFDPKPFLHRIDYTGRIAQKL